MMWQAIRAELMSCNTRMFRPAQRPQIQAHACIGGKSVGDDIRKLDYGQHIVSGTPGRVFDMIRRRNLRTRNIKTLILDEADEMLNQVRLAPPSPHPAHGGGCVGAGDNPPASPICAMGPRVIARRRGGWGRLGRALRTRSTTSTATSPPRSRSPLTPAPFIRRREPARGRVGVPEAGPVPRTGVAARRP